MDTNKWTANFIIEDSYVNEELLKELVGLHRKWQDEVDRYLIYNFFCNSRPRGLTKTDAWWYNMIYATDRIMKFKKKMDKELESIRSPYSYDYGHYFTKEKYYE